MNLKELVNQSLDIEKQLQDQYGIIGVDKEVHNGGRITLHFRLVKDFVSFIDGRGCMTRWNEKIHSYYVGCMVADFYAICLMDEEEYRVFEELTK